MKVIYPSPLRRKIPENDDVNGAELSDHHDDDDDDDDDKLKV